MPTTNNDDILEIDLPDNQEDPPVPESSVNGMKKKPRSIELDRVSALMTVFVAFGVVLIAICNSALDPNSIKELNHVVGNLCGFAAVGLFFAQSAIAAEFFVRSNAKLLNRIFFTMMFLVAVLYSSTSFYPTNDARDMTVLQLLLWSASALFQLTVQWTILFVHQKASRLSVDSTVFLSSWGERPSLLARILLMLVLLAVFFASLTQANFLLQYLVAGEMIFVGLMYLVANLIWATLIVFPQVRLASCVLVIAGVVACISILSLLSDPKAWDIFYLSYCVAACVGWLACGGLIKTVAAESNRNAQPSSEVSPG